MKKDERQKVIQELNELMEKYHKLHIQVTSEAFTNKTEKEQEMLKHQFEVMHEYLSVLFDRLINWKE